MISLALHLAAYGGWKWGQKHALWKRMTLPAWLQVAPSNLRSNLVRQLPSVQHPQPPPLLYVDVDPALITAEPPKTPKFYSTANTVAANPEKSAPTDQPKISGTQDKVMQTVAKGARSAPLQPSAPAEQKAETEQKESAESKAQPKEALAAGDLVDAKPAKKVEEKKGTSDSDNGTAAATEPKHERPRTLADARARSGAPNPRMRQEGGANHIAPDSSVDAVQTSYGDYDRELIDAIQARWDELLTGRVDTVTGKVILDFNLHADGRITDMKIEYSDVNELLALICKQAVLDPARYKVWPAKMRQEITDPRQLRFTFYYSY